MKTALRFTSNRFEIHEIHGFESRISLLFNGLPSRFKNLCESRTLPHPLRIEGEKHIEGETKNTSGPGSVGLLSLRGKIIEGETRLESFGILHSDPVLLSI